MAQDTVDLVTAEAIDEMSTEVLQADFYHLMLEIVTAYGDDETPEEG